MRTKPLLGALLGVFLLAAIFAPGAEAAPRVRHIHVRCGEIIDAPGRYVVMNSLRGCTGEGLEILASHVHIDLGHHRISGAPGLFGVGTGDPGAPTPAPLTDLSVRNGTIRGFSVAVFFGDVSAGTVTKIRATVAPSAVLTAGVVAGPDVTVTRSRFSGFQKGVVALADDHITGNTFSGGLNGIAVFFGGNDIERNVVQSTSGAGIVVDCPTPSTTNTIAGNVVRDAALDGIFMCDGAIQNVIAGNRSEDNGIDGIHVGTGNIVVNNEANGNKGDGIEITSPDETSFVAGNVADNNVFLGIRASGGPSDVVTDSQGNQASGNGDANECQPTTLCHA